MSSHAHVQTKAERKAAARRARQAAEAAEAARQQRNRRLKRLGALVGAAAVVVVIAIVVGAGGGSATSRPAIAERNGEIPGRQAAASMLAGIPQQGIRLGRANAPVRLVEFADLQCPICREYTLQSLPTLIRDYVRTGKVQMEFRNVAFIGPDSVKAGQAASAAARQNRLWNFADVFYVNQGEENSGYVTPSFVNAVNRAAGVSAGRASAFAATPAARAPIAAADQVGNQYGVTGTPTVLVGPRGGSLTRVNVAPTDTAGYAAAIKRVLGSA
jgi:protein-disulfide isomerase